VIHHAALNMLGLSGEYRLFPVPPAGGEEAAIRELLAAMRDGTLHGLNVTIPHKQTVIPLLDALTPAAQAIGAVNTIFRQNGQVVGDNTDALGFYQDLMACWRRIQRDIPADRPRRALVLGSGGSARAVTYILARRGWQVIVAARRPEVVETAWRDRLDGVIPWETRTNLAKDTFDLVVNCTPLGMPPHTEGSPWPAGAPFPAQAIVYDLVYNPEETTLLRQARQAGHAAFSGLGMLIEQAALAFERWTGFAAPRAAMHLALSKHTRTRQSSSQP